MFILANIEKKRNLTGHCGVYWKNRGIFRIGTPGCAPPKNIQRTREGGWSRKLMKKMRLTLLVAKVWKRKSASRKSTTFIFTAVLQAAVFLLLFHKFYYKIAEKGQVAFLFYITMHIIYLQSIGNKKD